MLEHRSDQIYKYILFKTGIIEIFSRVSLFNTHLKGFAMFILSAN